MAVCYFDGKVDKTYRCEYEIKKDIIEVTVDYDIKDEIEAINGVKAFGINTEYKKRNIIIADHNNKKNYLLKNAYCAGHTSVYGTLDGGSKTKFQSQIYFEHVNLEDIDKLPETPKVTRIKIFSKSISNLIGCPSLMITENEDEYTIGLLKKGKERSIEIGVNNIKKIVVADDWSAVHSQKEHSIKIDFNGYIEIELVTRVNYDRVYEFVNELKVFMQLFWPDKFRIDKILVVVDEIYYKMAMPEREIRYRDKYINTTVEDNLLNFLKRCYTTIPYRNSKAEIRNIPYIVMKTARGLEDNFLAFYRFIECYYKKQPILNIASTFVSYSIKEHYTKKHALSDEQIERYAQEIICLRNQYVHAGYYIKNSSLRISFDKINRKKNPKDYTVNTVDVQWIYDRTMILYRIAVDIIFSRMLGYEDYKYDKHF